MTRARASDSILGNQAKGIDFQKDHVDLFMTALLDNVLGPDVSDKNFDDLTEDELKSLLTAIAQINSDMADL